MGEGVEDLAGDGVGGEEEGLVRGLFHYLTEHLGGELVGLIAGGDADDGEVRLLWGSRGKEWDSRVGVGRFFGTVVGEFGDQLADGEEEEVAADVVEDSLVAILFYEGEGGDEDGVVELDERFSFEEAVGDGMGFLLIHGEEPLVEESFGGELGIGAEESVEEGHLRNVTAEDDDADGEWSGEDEAGPSPEKRPEDRHGEKCERRDAGAGAEEPRFDKVSGGEFEHEEETDDENRRQP